MTSLASPGKDCKSAIAKNQHFVYSGRGGDKWDIAKEFFDLSIWYGVLVKAYKVQ